MATVGNGPRLQSLAASAGAGSYYSIAEAAGRLGVSRVTIWRWIRDGRLPAARLGHRTTRINQRDLDRILASNGFADGRTAGPRETPMRENHTNDPLAPRADWWEVHASEHLVQFYETDAFLLDAISDFIGSALRTGDAALVVATPSHRDALHERIAAYGLNLASAEAAGQYMSLDAAETLARFMVDGMPDRERFAEVVGGIVGRLLDGRPRLRIFGEMVALLASEVNDTAAVLLEQLWNELRHDLTFSLMCGYPMQRLGGEPLAHFVREVCREHSRVIPAESYSALDGPDDRLRAIALLQQKAGSLELEIAERKRAEEVLRHKESELRDFLEQGVMGLHWVGPDGTILWANQAEMDLLGYAAEQYIGHHISEFYVDQEVIEDVLGRLKRREAIREREVRLRCADGRTKYVLVSSNALFDGDAFVHTRCFTVDVTPRKLAEQRLAVQYGVTRTLSESHALSEAVTSILACVCETLGWEAGGLWLVDDQAGVLRCPQFWHAPSLDFAEFEAVSRAYAFAPGTGLPGRVWSTGQPAWIDDVLEDANFARAPHAASTGLHAAFAFPVRVGARVLGVMDFFSREIKKPDENILALMAGVGGQIGQFMELKRAEVVANLERQRLQEVFTRAPAAVALVCGPEHVFEFANPLFLQTVGRTDVHELLGRTLRDALPELEPQGYLNIVDNVYRTGEPFVGQELRVQLRLGRDDTTQEGFFNVLLQPFVGRNGQVEGIVSHAVEVTEQVRARQRVEELAQQLQEQLASHINLNRELREIAEARDRALAELQQLLRARDEFLSSVAHDLKNPLANMKGQAQLVRRRLARAGTMQPEQVLAGLASIDGSATRMGALIDDLLDTARIELGRPMELRRRATDLVALAQHVAAEHQQATESHRIRVQAAVPTMYGNWDAERLDRVLTNLLNNALKYSPDGGEVLVTIEQEDRAAVLAVRDEGIGVPAADLPHIFERFRRGSNVAGRIGGTGIGLAGVRALVEDHGGTIAVESQEGVGSTFTVRLPL